MITQGLHHFPAILGVDLNHHAQFFIEQGFECQFMTTGANLLSPVFGIAMVGTAV